MKKHIMSLMVLLFLVTIIHYTTKADNPNNIKRQPTMEDLIKIRQEGNYSCVILNGEAPRTFNQRGVADLYDLLKSEPTLLKGATMVDKVVGKGAASLMIVGGIKRLHTDIICTTAIDMLRAAGVEVTYDREVEFIYNMSKTDWCPLEKLCKDTPTAQECIPIVEGFIKSMRSSKK